MVVKHPLFGVIVAVVASREIRRGEELYCNYNYDTEEGPDWYTRGYKLYLEKRNREKEGEGD